MLRTHDPSSRRPVSAAATPYGNVLKVGAVALAVGAAFSPGRAHAAQVTDVLDSFDGGDGFHGTFGVHYRHEQKSSRILREWVCQGGTAGSPNPLCPSGSTALDTNQLQYQETKNLLELELRAGLWRDLQLTLSLPIVVGWTSTLDHADGVSADNSLVSSPLIPSIFDVPYESASRVGLGDMVIGLDWAPIHESRSPGMPSWVIGFAYTAPTGTARKAGDTGAGGGVHAIALSTAISRRFGPADPWIKLGTTLRFPSASGPFQNERTTQTRVSPGNDIELGLGSEFHLWNSPTDEGPYLSLDVGFRSAFTFEGREYSELFDALGASGCDPSRGCTRTSLARVERGASGETLIRKSDGVTDVEQYATFGAELGVTYQPMKYLRLRLGFDYSYTTDHFITFADAGRDLDASGNVEGRNSQSVNEYNPFYNEATDAYGRRFRASASHSWGIIFGVEGRL
ncbi:MAG: hypothetical protein IV100_22395 [Myxococcales bacterium]|nr:hypothetical protein [Myxococcales bacterium]